MDDDQTHVDGRAGRDTASLTASDIVMSVVKQETEAFDDDEAMASPRDTRDSQWNQEEHARFMQALETYGGEQSGDEWRKITAVVHTRSMDEVRLHGRRYLQHLMHLHQLQQLQSQTAQQQQQRLLQLSRMGRSPLLAQGLDPLQYPLTASREIQNNQNDPNGPNHRMGADESAGSKAATSATKAKMTGSRATTTPSPLSAAALSVANAMNAHAFTKQGDAQPVASSKNASVPASGGGGGGLKPKVWSFQEDKVLEVALASWQTGKPYSWPKIAATLPGKTAKDVRLRYEQLVDDVTSIETVGGLKHPPQPPSAAMPTATTTVTMSASLPPKPPTATATARVGNPYARPPPHSGLSSRIAPPPPIQVPPPSTKGKATSSLLDSPGIFPGSTRGRFVMTPSFGGSSSISGMLSPTFLDFLADEDKQSMPFSGLNDLPSPLMPSPVSGGPLTSPLGLDFGATSGSRSRNRPLATPKGLPTPRIWQEFLSEDFKFDAKAPSPRLPTDGSRTSVASGSAQRRKGAKRDHTQTQGMTPSERRLHDMKTDD